MSNSKWEAVAQEMFDRDNGLSWKITLEKDMSDYYRATLKEYGGRFVDGVESQDPAEALLDVLLRKDEVKP